jgi:hypothetical protein
MRAEREEPFTEWCCLSDEGEVREGREEREKEGRR